MSTSTITASTPVIKPPDGVTSNFIDPPSWHLCTLGVGITCMALMTLVVGVRTYTKAVILRQMKHEDYAAIFALFGFLAWGGIYLYLSSIGLTRDLWNIRAIDFPRMLYLFNIIELVYSPSMCLAKYFIGIQLKRIFCPQRTDRGVVWWALMGLIVASCLYYTACFFTFLFQCIPREKIWNPALEGKCIDDKIGLLLAGVLNFLLDLGLLLVPIWAIWHLHISIKSKLGAIAIFSVGIFTCIIAAFGVAYRVPLMTAENQTREIAKVGLWCFGELLGTFVVGCIPMFPRFYEHFISGNGLLSTIRSIRPSLGSSADRITNNSISKASRYAKNKGDGRSQEHIVVSSEFALQEEQRNPDSIELEGGTRHGRRHDWT